MASQTPVLTSPTTQMLDVHNVQSNNPKGKQKTKGKRKSKGKKVKGDNKVGNNVGEGKKKKRKVNFSCNLYMARLVETQNLLAQQQPIVLTNPFPQGKNMAQDSSSMDVPRENQGSPTPNFNSGASNVYMMRSNAHL